MDSPLRIGKHEFRSRIFLGTGKFATLELMATLPGVRLYERSGYRSKHRQASPGSVKQSDKHGEGRRSGPRHAAPSARFTSRRSARLSVFPLPARG